MDSISSNSQNTQVYPNEIVSFLQKLIERLHQENENLQANLTANNAKNEQLQTRKSKIFADLQLNGPPSTEVYINEIITISTKWLTITKTNAQQLQQAKNIMREEYRVNCETAKYGIPINSTIDEYTMMPFHNLETLIGALKNQISGSSLEARSMLERYQKELEDLSAQLSQMVQDIETLKSFENEIK